MRHSLRRFNLPLKPALVFFSVIFFYFLLPLYLAPASARVSYLFLFYSLNLIIAIYLWQRFSRQKEKLILKQQDIREEKNLLEEEFRKQQKNRLSLQAKINRYQELKMIIEEINENLNIDFITEKLTEIAFSLISSKKGNCILYLADSQNQKLLLYKSKKEDDRLVIKEKEGDIFDLWVLRHTTPLFMENIRKDFRFDLEKLKNQSNRPVSSLICAPFASEHKIFGLLRLEHPDPANFTQDDLRFLVTICELGAMAIENGQLFAKTQELAIHDSLTALYTRGYFQEILAEEVKRCLRSNQDLSLLMMDIDYFKDYNDKFGHAAGDIVLKKIGQTINDTLREFGAVSARFGGEEFCILLPRVEKNKAKSIAECLLENIHKTKIILRRQETYVNVSIGVAGLFADAQDEQELFLKADRALFLAKEKGRDRVVLA